MIHKMEKEYNKRIKLLYREKKITFVKGVAVAVRCHLQQPSDDAAAIASRQPAASGSRAVAAALSSPQSP